MERVECPRCRLQLTARLHMLSAVEPQQCPRCWESDRFEVPMIFLLGRREFSRTGRR
jgi:hypothetical protein